MQKYSSIEEIQLVLRVKKESETGLLKNQRLLAIKSGYISYYSKIPKQFVGNTRSLQLIGELPKYTFSAQHVTKITYLYPILEIEFLKDKLIDKNKLKKIIENKGLQENDNFKETNKTKLSQQHAINKSYYWRFKSKQIDLTNAFVQQVKTCMKPQQEEQNKLIDKNVNDKVELQKRRLSLQPSLKIVSDAFKLAQQQRQYKQVTEIINERSSMYFTSEQIEIERKKRLSEGVGFNSFGKNNNKSKTDKKKKKYLADVSNQLRPIEVPQAYQQSVEQIVQIIKNQKQNIQKIQQVQKNNQMKINNNDKKIEKQYQNQKEQLNQQQYQQVETENNKQIIDLHQNTHNNNKNDITQIETIDNNKNNNNKVENNIEKQQQQQYQQKQQIEYNDNNKIEQIDNENSRKQQQQQQLLFKSREKNNRLLLEQQQDFINNNEENDKKINQIIKQQVNNNKVVIVKQEQQQEKACYTAEQIIVKQSQQFNQKQIKIKDKYQQISKPIQILQSQPTSILHSQKLQQQLQYLITKNTHSIKKQQQTITSMQQKSNNSNKYKQPNNKHKHKQPIQTKYSNSKIKQQSNTKNKQSIKIKQQQDNDNRQSIIRQFVNNIESSSSHYQNRQTEQLQYRKQVQFQSVKQFTLTYHQSNTSNASINKQSIEDNRELLNVNINVKRQRYIMFTDWINYSSLLVNYDDDEELLKEQYVHQYISINSLVYSNNRYRSKLYDNYRYRSKLYDKFKQHNKKLQNKVDDQQTDIEENLYYYIRYKHYQGLIINKASPLTNNLHNSNYNKQTQSIEQIQSNKQINTSEYMRQIVSSLNGANIIQSYQCLQMVRKLCIQEVCLYFKQNKHYSKDIVNNIIKCIKQRQQYKLINQSLSQSIESQQLINKLIETIICQLLNIQHNHNSYNLIVSLQQSLCISNNQPFNHPKHTLHKYHLIADDSQTQTVSRQQQYNLHHKQKQFISINQSQISNIINQYYKHILLSLVKSSLFQLINPYSQLQQQIHSINSTYQQVRLVKQKFIKMFNKLIQQLNNINSKYNQLNYNITQSRKSQQKHFNYYLSQQSIKLSLHILNLQLTLAYYQKEKQNTKNNNIKLVQQIKEDIQKEIIRINSLLKCCLQELKVYQKKLITINQSTMIQKVKNNFHKSPQQLKINNRVIESISTLIVHYVEKLFMFSQFIKQQTHKPFNQQTHHNLTKTIKPYVSQSSQCALDIVQLLQNLTFHPNKQSIKHHHINKHKHHLEIIALTSNNNKLTQSKYTQTIIRLLILTIDNKQQYYFIKTLYLLIQLWKHHLVNDTLIIQTFISIQQYNYLTNNSQLKSIIQHFLDHQIKTQDKLYYLNQYPKLYQSYHQ